MPPRKKEEAPEPVAVEEAPDPKNMLADKIVETLNDNPDIMAKVLTKATEHPQVRRVLGIAGVDRQRTKQTNKDVRQFVGVYGEASHPPLEDGTPWTPTPPENVVRLGQYAVDRWKNDWLDGKQSGSIGAIEVDEEVALQSIE